MSRNYSALPSFQFWDVYHRVRFKVMWKRAYNQTIGTRGKYGVRRFAAAFGTVVNPGKRKREQAPALHINAFPYFAISHQFESHPLSPMFVPPLAVSDVKDTHPLAEAVIAAGVDAGMPRNNDFNGAKQAGVGYFQGAARKGLRCSAAVGYLRPAMKRANLDVVTHALASREVLVCAGAIQSPQLLQRSGFGPAALRAPGLNSIGLMCSSISCRIALIVPTPACILFRDFRCRYASCVLNHVARWKSARTMRRRHRRSVPTCWSARPMSPPCWMA